MTTQTVNQIEAEFAQLSVEDQSFLLERLAQQREMRMVQQPGFRGPFPRASTTGRELPRNTHFAESSSAGADLLSEAW